MKTKESHNKVLEHKIYDLIRDHDGNDDMAANSVDGVLMILIIISVVVAFLSTFEIANTYMDILNTMETFFILIFSIEYGIRLWTSEFLYPDLPPLKARLKYALTPMALIDLLSILPFFLPFFGVSTGAIRIMRIVRLFRVFKINRYTDSLYLIGAVLRTRASQLISSIVVILVLIFIAAMLMYDVEHAAQPDKFNNALSAMWWAMSTITTVGYGDIYPITTFGRILSAIVTFLGIGLTAIPTGILSAGFIEQTQLLNKKKEKSAHVETCPHCGKPVH